MSPRIKSSVMTMSVPISRVFTRERVRLTETWVFSGGARSEAQGLGIPKSSNT